jgi:translation initiation factor IF-2
VDGSVEALSSEFSKLSTEEIQINIIHKGVGAITETDVMLASASDAIIIGFNVRPAGNAKALADKEEIDIRNYSIIYAAIDDLKDAMEGMLSPELKE